MERIGWWLAKQKTIDRDRKGSPSFPHQQIVPNNELIIKSG
jgi:hypothetical protein